MRVMRRNVAGMVATTVAAMLVLACSDKGQQREVGGMMLTVMTDPAVPEVGRDAVVTATLQRGGAPVRDCGLRVRQYMPGMEMSGDNIWHALESGDSSGKYRATIGEFSMGGEWQLEFAITCGDAAHQAAIPYHLEWPE